MSFKRGELAASWGCGAATFPSQEILNSMAARRSPQGSGPNSAPRSPSASPSIEQQVVAAGEGYGRDPGRHDQGSAREASTS